MRTLLHLILLALLLGCAACVSLSKDPPTMNAFLLDANRQGDTRPEIEGLSLRIDAFTVSPALADRAFLIARGGGSYERDYYNRFLVDPQENISMETAEWLERSGLFPTVNSPVSDISAERRAMLTGNLRALSADYSDAGQATLEIRYFLFSGGAKDQRLALQKTYTATAPLTEKSPEQLVVAWNQCLAEILGQLETDIAMALTAPAP